ncbi:sarcosine oxidase subunit gamma family protein [Actinoplanes sp. NPDC051633]|uniref:sarcosine oxidase subunit gamma n=1 Tax=Actinoplanes sp. NPDC051633 TaxID=3155670 RepID=UPI0034246240
MAELTRTHPLDAWTASFAALSPAVSISVQPYVPMFNVRSAPPTGPNTWVDLDAGRAVWLGPDEWLSIGALPSGGSVTDVSAQRIIVRLTGARVRQVLPKGCAIDLHPRVFGRGRTAQTTLGRAGVVLLSLSESGDDYLVLVRSSFAGYLADWLLDAALEFG